jgi:hypothetical protein
LVAVGTTRALLFQLHHRQESILLKDDVLKGQTSEIAQGEVRAVRWMLEDFALE